MMMGLWSKERYRLDSTRKLWAEMFFVKEITGASAERGFRSPLGCLAARDRTQFVPFKIYVCLWLKIFVRHPNHEFWHCNLRLL